MRRTVRTASIVIGLCLLAGLLLAPATASASVLPDAGLATSFGNPIYYGTGHYAYDCAVGDLDGDGDNDIVTADSSDGFSVALNNGAGACTVTTEGPATYVGGVLLADLNGDGDLDLIAQTLWAGHSYTLYAGNGDGTFSHAGYIDFGTMPSLVRLADDFTGDGTVDLLLGTNNGDDSLLFPGNGDFTFGSPSTITGIGYNNWGGDKGDIDNDGHPDFVIANIGSPNLDIRLNDGTGGFTAPDDLVVSDRGTFPRLADFDQDGKLDLVVTYQYGTYVSVFKGDGAGGFADRHDIALTGISMNTIDVADVNGDGIIDIIAGGQQPDGYPSKERVLLNNGLGEFPEIVTPYVWDEWWAAGLNKIVAARMNSDVLPDLVATHVNAAWSQNVTVQLNTGAIPGNRKPSITATSAATVENVPCMGPVATDPDGDSLGATTVPPAHGAFSVAADGSYSYTPDADWSGTDTFVIRAFDGYVYSPPATFTVTVTGVPDPPVAVDDSYTLSEDTTLVVGVPGVLGNDSDPDGTSPWIYTISSISAGGDLNLLADGSFTYRPAADFNGTETLTYQVTDGALQSNVATISFVVTPVNDAPVARADTAAVDEDTTLTVDAPGVLSNDGDVDGDALTADPVNPPAHGTLDLASDGGYSYRPSLNWNGTDAFSYRAYDGQAYSDPVTVTVTVRPVADDPIALDDEYSTNEDVYLNVPAPGMLGNDLSPDGRPLELTNVTVVHSGGYMGLYWTGEFHLQPATDFNGDVVFTYKAYDGVRYSNTATVTIHVLPVNDQPHGHDDTATVDEDTTLTGAAPGVLANDSDPEGDPLSAQMVDGAQNGTATLNADGSYTYRPNADFSGEDYFTYRVSDGALTYGVMRVTVTVNPVNDPPVGNPDAYSMAFRAPFDPEAVSVLANDSDIDGGQLSAVVATGPAHGTLISFAPNGYFSYLPATGFFGKDTFTYRVFDGTAYSQPVTVTITVGVPPATVKVDRPFTPYKVNRNTAFLVYGGISVWHAPGKPAVSLRCYRLERGVWVFHKKVVLYGTSSATKSRYAGYVALPESGAWSLVALHVDENGMTSRSPARYMFVR